MKPMLSATLEDVNDVIFPALCSPKLDGIRCLIVDGRPVSRNLKDIPNKRIWHELYDLKLPALDGELIVGDPKAKDCYRKTNSGVMSHEGSPNWVFWVFDAWPAQNMPFTERLRLAKAHVQHINHKRIRMVPHLLINNAEKLNEYEANHMLAGYEGVMGRALDGPYKFGRATMREGWLWKLKRFMDGEAMVLGFDEQMHNGNEATKDELGRTKRSSHKSGKTGKGTLGALKVRDMETNIEFDVGTGFTDADRASIWAERPKWLGKIIKYKWLPIGVKEKPRHPVYLGQRLDI